MNIRSEISLTRKVPTTKYFGILILIWNEIPAVAFRLPKVANKGGSMQDKMINIGDIELHLREYPQARDAVIFLHYGGGNLMMWQRIVPYFQDKYRLVLIDLRGHGQSDRPQKGHSIDQMAEDVFQVMKRLQLDQAHIIGSSMGAEISLSLAAKYPNQVLSLVCDGGLYSASGPYGVWEGSDTEFQAHVQAEVEKRRDAPLRLFPSVNALVEDSKKMFAEAGWWNETFESVIRHDATRIDEGKYTNSWGLIAAEYMEDYLMYRFEDCYSKLRCPILMLPDTFHGLSPREKSAMEGLLKLTQHGRIVHIPGWIHPYGWMVTPGEVSKAVLDFYTEIKTISP